MLQNRVDPFGNIITTRARGSFMGNRGLIHDQHQKIVRPFKLKAWITCLLEFKGRYRVVMTPGRYTELFFLDEATAFAAGHRPCAECRRQNYNRFKICWIKGNSEYGFDEKTSVIKIDDIIHQERITSEGAKITYEAALENIPDGVFISMDDQPFLFANGLFFKWSPAGYQQGIVMPVNEKLTVLTPRSIVNSFIAGYTPQMALPLP